MFVKTKLIHTIEFIDIAIAFVNHSTNPADSEEVRGAKRNDFVVEVMEHFHLFDSNKEILISLDQFVKLFPQTSQVCNEYLQGLDFSQVFVEICNLFDF